MKYANIETNHTSNYLNCPSCAENTIFEYLYKLKKIYIIWGMNISEKILDRGKIAHEKCMF